MKNKFNDLPKVPSKKIDIVEFKKLAKKVKEIFEEEDRVFRKKNEDINSSRILFNS